MVPGVDEILGVVDDFDGGIAIHGQLNTVLRGNGVLQNFLRAVRFHQNGHGAGSHVGNGNFHLGLARVLGQFHLDGGCGVGIASGLDLHRGRDGLAILLSGLNGLFADPGLCHRLALAVLGGGEGRAGGTVSRGGFGGLRAGGHAVFVGFSLRLRFRLRTVLGGDGFGLAFRHCAVLLGLSPGLAFDLRAVLVGHGLGLCFGFRSVWFRIRFRLRLGHAAVFFRGGFNHCAILLGFRLSDGAVGVGGGFGLHGGVAAAEEDPPPLEGRVVIVSLPST